MELKNRLYLGLICTLALAGCAGFTYRYYGLADVGYEHGTLLGPSEKDDLPFSKCAPNAESKHPCVIMFTKEYMAFKQDYLDTQAKLIACEKNLR